MKLNKQDLIDFLVDNVLLEHNVVNHYNQSQPDKDWKDKIWYVVRWYIDQVIYDKIKWEDNYDYTLEDLEELKSEMEDLEHHERADWNVDIYTSDLWKRANEFSWETEDAMDEFDYDKNRWLIGLFQMGQYQAYDTAWYDIKTNIENWVDNQIEVMSQDDWAV